MYSARYRPESAPKISDQFQQLANSLGFPEQSLESALRLTPSRPACSRASAELMSPCLRQRGWAGSAVVSNEAPAAKVSSHGRIELPSCLTPSSVNRGVDLSG